MNLQVPLVYVFSGGGRFSTVKDQKYERKQSIFFIRIAGLSWLLILVDVVFYETKTVS